MTGSTETTQSNDVAESVDREFSEILDQELFDLFEPEADDLVIAAHHGC